MNECFVTFQKTFAKNLEFSVANVMCQ